MQPPFLNKISPKIKQNIAIILVIFLSSSAAFGLGRLSILLKEKEPITIEDSKETLATSTGSGEVRVEAEPLLSEALITAPKPNKIKTQAAARPPPEPVANSKPVTFVASRTGKSYYFPWCGIVKRIKKENLINFNSKEEAEKAGYKVGNCAGMK